MDLVGETGGAVKGLALLRLFLLRIRHSGISFNGVIEAYFCGHLAKDSNNSSDRRARSQITAVGRRGCSCRRSVAKRPPPPPATPITDHTTPSSSSSIFSTMWPIRYMLLLPSRLFVKRGAACRRTKDFSGSLWLHLRPPNLMPPYGINDTLSYIGHDVIQAAALSDSQDERAGGRPSQ
jgi:hypothetical protein